MVKIFRLAPLQSNQSPVAKFYNNTYREVSNRSKIWSGVLENVKAMYVYIYGTIGISKHTSGKPRSHPGQVDYILKRSEDLVLDPDKPL